tara:strand:+ start:3400 stop:5124 length:1725 start_codon:yes stop_codon:yes gene_type:complete
LGLKVLSLFDGMSCGQLALQKLGIEVDTYYASEIDKFAIQVTQANFPNTIQVGDVCELKVKDFKDVNLILAGSPCQGFSFAGKQLAFDDPRSALFFEFVRLLKGIKPKYFLLENVKMKQQFQDVITEQVSACYPNHPGDLFGSQIKPILINSALLSAQNRQRLYWTNIPNVEQPVDKGIVLKDILEDQDLEEYALSEVANERAKNNPRSRAFKPGQEKSGALLANQYKQSTDSLYALKKPKQVGLAVEKVKVRKHEVDILGLQKCILDHLAQTDKSKREIAKELNDKYSTVEHYFRKVGSDFFAIPSEEHWPELKKILGITTDEFDKSIMEFEIKDGVYETTQRVYSQEGKSPTLTSAHAEKLVETKPKQVGIATDINGHDILKRVYSPDGKSPTLNTMSGGNREPKVIVGAWRGRYNDDGKTQQKLELNRSGKSNSLTTVQKDNVIVKTEPNQINPSKKASGKQPYMQDRIFHKEGKSHALTSSFADRTNVGEPKLRTKSKTVRSGGRGSYDRHEWDSVDDLHWRKLTPLECERLQTVPDNYTNHVSNSQRFRMLGNGWTVDVIAHILNNMEL